MPIQSKVKGIGGHAQATYKGAVQWKVQDDQRLIHHFTLPNMYHVSTAPSWILCPQHLAQTAQDIFPNPLGTGEVMGGQFIQLFWNQQKYWKMIKLDPKKNIGITTTVPGIQAFSAFLAHQTITTPSPCCFNTHVIPENDNEASQAHETSDEASLQP